MNKKTKFAILGVIALALVTLSLTYAYWLITQTQTKENAITAGCLDISLSNEQNDISLTEQFPLSDEEGSLLTPYTFTVTNNCSNSVDYNVNLEVLGDKESNISSSSIKVMLDDGTPVLVGDKLEVETTNADAYEAHLITQGTLESKGSASHSLRLWIDENAPISEINKTFNSKVSVTAGQGIINPIKEGTLAYNLVSQYDGTESISSQSYIWSENWEEEVEYKMSWIDEERYFGTDYTFDKKTGNFMLVGDLVKTTIDKCKDGSVICGKYSLLMHGSIEPTNTARNLYEITSFNGESADTIKTKINIANNGFSKEITAGEKSLHNIKDDYGISYYLKGDVNNNYVKFGQHNTTLVIGNGNSWLYSGTEYFSSLDECNSDANYNVDCTIVHDVGDPMYWRIIRINGDGTVRLIYDGNVLVDNNTSHRTVIARSVFDTNKNSSFSYNDGEGSSIKKELDNWYENNLKTNYEQYLADSIFCNDKSMESATRYNSIIRRSIISPSLICSQKSDRYTKNDILGNKLLNNPIGLITNDELLLVGNTKQNNKHYLRNSLDDFWTMTPAAYSSTNGDTIYVNIAGNVTPSVDRPTDYDGVRPVINLKADVIFTGNGSIETPYVITTN